MSTDFRGGRLVVIAAGLLGIAAITAALYPLSSSSHTVPALLFVVPIATTSVFAGWRASMVVALAAATAYAMAFLPPIGAVRVGLTEDVFALVTFMVVAVVVGLLKGPSRTPPLAATAAQSEQLLDDGRAVLLRGVSHDLRNPLNTIRLVSTDLLAGGVRDATTRDQMLGLVVDESERLDRIVGNLLSLSRVQAGALVPQLARTSVDDLVGDAVFRLGRLHRRPISVEIASDLPDVLIDVVQIDQVLTNLVENAFAHGGVDAAVRITAATVDDEVVVTVADDGPGLPDHVLDQLFVAPVASSSSGLGLTVCKAIVDAHGGRIWFRSPRPSGALVSFSLPVAH